MIKMTSPLSYEAIRSLRTGDCVLLSGEVYTARDAAHQRLVRLLADAKPLPFDIRGQTVYYAGPCPAPNGKVIGSVGPTTSARMDVYAGRLMREGLCVMIGKGSRDASVCRDITKYGGVYFAAIGGAGALYAQCVERAETVAFEDLGPEAVYRLSVRDMPLVVAVDCSGNSLYETGEE